MGRSQTFEDYIVQIVFYAIERALINYITFDQT